MEETQSPEALNPTTGEDTSAVTPPVAEPTTSVEAPVEVPVEGEPTPAVEPAPTTEAPTEHQPERPAERRIRNLVSENKRLYEDNSRLLAQAPNTSPQAPTLSSMVAGRESIEPSELDKIGEQFVAQTSTAAASLEVSKLRHEMQQKEAVNQYESDQREVEKLYPELDPDSSEYNPIIEEKVAQAWQRQAIQVNPYNQQIKTINPQIRLADVAKDYMEVAKASVQHGQQTASAALAANQDLSAIAPNAAAPEPETAFEDKSLSEMEADLRAKGYKI